MDVTDQFHEQSSLHNETSLHSGATAFQQNTFHQKVVTLLHHLKDNRIFYFILTASFLVLVIMMQIRTAYRTYDDNQRLVKLWLQEKELKDIMSHKNKQMKDPDPQLASQIVFTKVKDNSTRTDKISLSQRLSKIAPKNMKQGQMKPLNGRNRMFDTSRPVAGIGRAQLLAQKRWLQLKNEDIYTETPLSEQQRKYYEQKYHVSQFEQLPFCVVIPSHNNAQNNRHIKNIRTIIMQDYLNYHIVFIDDASTDGTGDQIAAVMKNQTKIPPQRFTLIKNTEQFRAMPNLRRAANELCKPHEIFLIIDGDDELIGRQVLKLYNSVFQKQKAWFVYSNFISVRGNVGYSRPFPAKVIANNSYRKYPFVTSHLRAFYTQLFLNIKQEDLKDNKGNYLKAANDVAICLPILEQSHEKVAYVRELTYFYNSNTGQNNHQLRLREQKENDRMLRKRKPYQPLTSFYIDPEEPPKDGKR